MELDLVAGPVVSVTFAGDIANQIEVRSVDRECLPCPAEIDHWLARRSAVASFEHFHVDRLDLDGDRFLQIGSGPVLFSNTSCFSTISSLLCFRVGGCR